MRSTVPVSSTMPVNMTGAGCGLQVAGCKLQLSTSTDQGREQHIRAEAAMLDFAQRDDLGKVPDSGTSDGFDGVSSADDFWRVEEGDAMGQTAQQERRIHFAAAFHKH